MGRVTWETKPAGANPCRNAVEDTPAATLGRDKKPEDAPPAEVASPSLTKLNVACLFITMLRIILEPREKKRGGYHPAHVPFPRREARLCPTAVIRDERDRE